MRACAPLVIFTAFVLGSVVANADPGQPAASAVVNSPTAPGNPVQPEALPTAAAAPPAAGNASPGTSAIEERVVVQGKSDSDSLDKIECRTSAPTTGTRLGGSRECRAVRDWKERQQNSQDMLERTQILGSQPLRSLTKAH